MDSQSTYTPFGRRNRLLFIMGIATIGLGYLLLSIPPATGFLSLTLAPIFLITGYCVIVPWAILAKDVDAKEKPPK